MKTKTPFFILNKKSFIKTIICFISLLGTLTIHAQTETPYAVSDITEFTVLMDPTPWVIKTNMQVGDIIYVDRTHYISALPTFFVGSTWIQTAATARAYTGTGNLTTFKVNSPADVYVAHVQGITVKPAWLSTWTECPKGDNNDFCLKVLTTGDICWFYKKSFPAGSTVELGQNGSTTRSPYTVIVKKNTINALNSPNSTPLLSVIEKSIYCLETGLFQIYDLSGTLVLQAKDVNKVNTNLSTGLYIVRFTGINGSSTSIKVSIK